MIRRLSIAAALAIGATVAGVGASGASAAPVVTAAPVGPECQQAVRDAVLKAVQGTAQPGQVIQYLQVIAQNGAYVLQLCTVTVPS